MHVFPRWREDELYEHHTETWWPPAAEKLPYAEKLRAALQALELSSSKTN